MKITKLDDLYDCLKSDRFSFSGNDFLSSNTPQECRNEECVLGVDEAGRGPVLGPMVYAISYLPKKRLSDLDDIGCADSKTLSEKQREEIFSVLCACDDYLGWSADVISPNFICNNMLKRQKDSLNKIAEEATINLIQSVLDENVNISEIYVDTVGPPDKYQQKLSEVFPKCKVTVSKKADSLYPIVSAASICAKVIRDITLQNWRFTEGLSYETHDIGSGYPNDPQTKTFLRDNVDDIFGYPQIVRFSWTTAQKALDNAASVEWEDEDDKTLKTDKRITTFFRSETNKSETRERHPFFRQRKLDNVSTF